MESFADLFAKEEPTARPRRWQIGDEVEAVVAHVGPDAVFVDLDAKQQGLFERPDLADDVKVGDTVKGRVIDIDASTHQVKLGTTLGRDADRIG